MKNIILLLSLVLVFGSCDLFKKKPKFHDDSNTNNTQTEETTTASTEMSSSEAIDYEAQAMPVDESRTVYYIVCGSYSTLDQAIQRADEMSEVVFYNVYKGVAHGQTVYRLCCQCYYNKADAQKDLNGIFSGFKNSDWWVWPSQGLAECVYRPYSPEGDNKRMPDLRPLSKALTE